jgi:hypothetical protein
MWSGKIKAGFSPGNFGPQVSQEYDPKKEERQFMCALVDDFVGKRGMLYRKTRSRFSLFLFSYLG